jgi:hypothetical protein
MPAKKKAPKKRYRDSLTGKLLDTKRAKRLSGKRVVAERVEEVRLRGHVIRERDGQFYGTEENYVNVYRSDPREHVTMYPGDVVEPVAIVRRRRRGSGK